MIFVVISIIYLAQQSQYQINQSQHRNYVTTDLLNGTQRSNSASLVKVMVHPQAMKMMRVESKDSEIEWNNKYMKSKNPQQYPPDVQMRKPAQQKNMATRLNAKVIKSRSLAQSLYSPIASPCFGPLLKYNIAPVIRSSIGNINLFKCSSAPCWQSLFLIYKLNISFVSFRKYQFIIDLWQSRNAKWYVEGLSILSQQIIYAQYLAAFLIAIGILIQLPTFLSKSHWKVCSCSQAAQGMIARSTGNYYLWESVQVQILSWKRIHALPTSKDMRSMKSQPLFLRS